MDWEIKSDLESIVRVVYDCNTNGAISVASEDYLGENPIAATLVCLAPFVKLHG